MMSLPKHPARLAAALVKTAVEPLGRALVWLSLLIERGCSIRPRNRTGRRSARQGPR